MAKHDAPNCLRPRRLRLRLILDPGIQPAEQIGEKADADESSFASRLRPPFLCYHGFLTIHRNTDNTVSSRGEVAPSAPALTTTVRQENVMADKHLSLTRREAIATGASAPVALLAPNVANAANAQSIDQDRSDAARTGAQLAMMTVARAWIDRWQAAGGDFGVMLDRDGRPRRLIRGVIEPDQWRPTDEGNAALPPHMWLVEEDHQRGAVKVLEAMLELLPDLAAAVREVAGASVFARLAGGEA
jgi:hypothetical protein